MLTYANVMSAPVDKLKTAVDDWSTMAGKLAQLAKDAREGMQSKADKADWTGVNAEVSQAFIRKVAKEFDDAAQEAKGIHLLLLDGHNAFKKAKDALQGILDGAEKANIVVDAQGAVTVRHSVTQDPTMRNDPDVDDLHKKELAAAAAWEERIRAIVDECDDADESLRLALAANVGEALDFTAPRFTSLDAEEAQRAYDLATKGDKLTHTELQQLNELLADNQKSTVFTTAFYEKLGPKGTLDFFAHMSTDTYTTTGIKDERLKDVQDLQRNLGLTLATATDPDNLPPGSPLATWSAEFRKLGAERLPLFPGDTKGVYGYQALAGILRYGDYDPRFLNPIAEHVVQLHEKNPQMFAENKRDAWEKNLFNPSGVSGAGYDPVVGILEALGHSPEAAKHFFTDKPTVYKQDGTVDPGAQLDFGETKDKNGKTVPIGYLSYFAREDAYEGFRDVGLNDPARGKGTDEYLPDAFGHALEAATLGRAWDDPQPVAVRDDLTAQVAVQVIDAYGNAALLKSQEPLADSIGRIGAGYIDDLNWALKEKDPNSVFAPKTDYPAHAQIDLLAARKFLTAAGQHPSAYADITLAEQVNITSMLSAEARPDNTFDLGRAKILVGTGAEVQGLLDESRGRQIEAEGMQKYEEYEKEQEKRARWVEFGTTAVIAGGIAFLPTAAVGTAAVAVPVAIDTGHGVIDQLVGQFLGNSHEKSLDAKKAEIEQAIQEERIAMYFQGEATAKSPYKGFLQQMGIYNPQDPNAVALSESMRIGYTGAYPITHQQGATPQTG
ncbi:hypothetical protein [Streptomyces sp. NPDC090025]|uniref:hypothetical protein n=1 Tax=Streptomyces sp. NPDC090025 TaxID=3365922 RepID=UPI003832E645